MVDIILSLNCGVKPAQAILDFGKCTFCLGFKFTGSRKKTIVTFPEYGLIDRQTVIGMESDATKMINVGNDSLIQISQGIHKM